MYQPATLFQSFKGFQLLYSYTVRSFINFLFQLLVFTLLFKLHNYSNQQCYYVHRRNPEPRSRPQFGQISKLLDTKSGYLLSWSDEDKQNNEESALKLGFPLEVSSDLYYDLQKMYR